MPQIVIDNASKSYGAVQALDDVSIAIESGTTTAVVGPSGGGKSTLLQLINGLVRPDGGRVLVFEQPIDYSQLPRLRLQIGYAVQGTGLFPHMDAWANITLLARLEGWSTERVRKRASHLMNLVGLGGALAHRYPHELSGGQKQRVGLCRAMMLAPEVFLLDEPFGALDPITRSEIHREFVKLQSSEPRTMVLVTHDLKEAFTLAGRIVILDDGRIVQDGTRAEILDTPAAALVRDLVHDQLGTWRPQ
jgi:osmoprotectant transport system ATP-binding protein